MCSLPCSIAILPTATAMANYKQQWLTAESSYRNTEWTERDSNSQAPAPDSASSPRHSTSECSVSGSGVQCGARASQVNCVEAISVCAAPARAWAHDLLVSALQMCEGGTVVRVLDWQLTYVGSIPRAFCQLDRNYYQMVQFNFPIDFHSFFGLLNSNLQ